MNDFSLWPVVMTVAGSDSGGGAGIQADLRAFACRQAFGTSAITAVTAQNPAGVKGIQGVQPEMVGLQMEAILESFPVAAVKTGMLYSAAIVSTVAARLQGRAIPLVVDPVMVASSGAVLLREDAVATLKDVLLPLATVITPNLPEAEILLGRNCAKRESECLAGARELSRRFGTAVYLKGGHGGGPAAVDYLCSDEGCWRFSVPWINRPTSHGTGCLFSAALAAGLAHGDRLVEAGRKAKAFVSGALRGCIAAGEGVFALMPEPELGIDDIDCQKINQ